MRFRFAALMAVTLLGAIILSTGCSKETSNSTNANTGSTTTASPAATATQPSVTPPTPTTSDSGAATPTAAFTAYYEAIKRQDIPTVKSLFSKATLSMMEEMAQQGKTTVEEVMKKGLEGVSKELPAELPETRNEKIDGDRATIEIKDDKRDKWDTVHFVRENGQWKISFGDR